MKLFRGLVFGACVLAVAAPAAASSITVLVGDKDGYGLGLLPGADLPWIAPIHDLRSAAEKVAINGAALTDTYSALYSGTENDCTGVGQTCSLNGDIGSVLFPFAGTLTGGSIRIAMGDFQCEFGPMVVDVNGVVVPFCFNDGYHKTVIRDIPLTAAMLLAANLEGVVRLNLDHRAGFDPQRGYWGSFDYIAFDYFELNAEVVPEPSTWLLFATGIAIMGARLRASRRSR